MELITWYSKLVLEIGNHDYPKGIQATLGTHTDQEQPSYHLVLTTLMLGWIRHHLFTHAKRIMMR